MHISAFIFLFVSALFASPSANPPKTVMVDLDNPLRDTLVVTIDDVNTHRLLPGETKSIKLKTGKHFVHVQKNRQFYHSAFFETYNDGLLNVAKTVYVVWKDIYMQEEKEEYYDNIIEEVVLIDGREYVGDIKLFDEKSVYIPKEWDYDVRTPFPEEVKLGNQPFVVKKKIYYKGNFIREYMKVD